MVSEICMIEFVYIYVILYYLAEIWPNLFAKPSRIYLRILSALKVRGSVGRSMIDNSAVATWDSKHNSAA